MIGKVKGSIAIDSVDSMPQLFMELHFLWVVVGLESVEIIAKIWYIY